MATYIKSISSGEITEVISLAYTPTNMPSEYTLVPQETNIEVSCITHYIDSAGTIQEYSADLVIQRMQGAPAANYVWDITKGWINAAPLETQKQQKQSQIDTYREQLLNNPVNYSGTLFDADPKSQQNVQSWQIAVNSGVSLPENFIWRDYYNTNHTADSQFIIGLGTALATRSTSIYQKSWLKKLEVDLLTTVEQVQAYDITTGWD